MIKKPGIAKGSFYNYTNSKEDLAGMEIDEYEKPVRHRLAIYKASLTHGIYKRNGGKI